MDHLDVLESRTIYILREAFNKIDKLAMLWSIGKDSNVMLWCARKAFFGHVPFPLVNIDTGKKFPEVYEFRDRIIKEWKLDCVIGECPPVEEMDPTLPPAARSGARKTAGLQQCCWRAKATRSHRRHPPRRGRHTCQGARVQPARRAEHLELPRPAAGVLGPVQHRLRARHPPARPSAAALDRAGHLALHQAREHPADQPVLRQERQAVPLAWRQGHHLPGRLQRRYDRLRSSTNCSTPRWPSGPAAPWTTRPKTPSSACAPKDTCRTTKSDRNGHDGHEQGRRTGDPDDTAAEDRHRRPRRPRQVDAGRPALPRHRLAAGRQASRRSAR